MRTSHIGMGVLAIAAITIGTACSFAVIECPYGVFPFSGATNVHPDTAIEFIAVQPLPPALPSLHSGLSLFDETTRRPVDFDVDSDFDAGMVWLIPVEPLEQGHVYTATGLHEELLEQSHSLFSLPNDKATTTFTVGRDPSWLQVQEIGDDNYLLLVFSESVHAEDIADALWQADAMVGSLEEVEPYAGPTVLGHYEGQDHILKIDNGQFTGSVLGLDEGWAGNGLGPTQTFTSVQFRHDPIERFMSLPFCERIE